MKKMPSLFVRIFEDHKIKTITSQVTKGCEWVFEEPVRATIKFDGTATYFYKDELWKRYDAKKGKKVPDGAIKCQPEADPVTGHLPCWVRVSKDNPGDKWFVVAYENALTDGFVFENDRTYELCGPHFQGNPENFDKDKFVLHGSVECKDLDVSKLSFDSIRDWLSSHYVEGIVFYRSNGEMCKIKRSDFGLDWKEKVRG